MDPRTVVLLPSNIYTTRSPYPGAEPKCQLYRDKDGNYQYKYYSTGLLEKALEQGHEIWVLDASTTPDRAYNQWWKALLPPVRVLPFHGFENISAPQLLCTMMDLYDRLGVPWDETIKTWPLALEKLRLYGILRSDGIVVS